MTRKNFIAIASIISVLTALFVIWLNLAVGIIGSEDNPVNLLYLGMIVIGLLGAFSARFRPQGLAITLYLVALIQVLIPVIALILWPPQVMSWGEAGVVGVFTLNIFLTAMWLVSALLFRGANKLSSSNIAV